MRNTFLVLGIVLAAALSGCMGGDEEEDEDDEDDTESPTDTDGTTEPGDELVVRVRIIEFPTNVTVGEPIEVRWVIEVDGHDGTLTTDHTAVHYANYSVPNPTLPSDYGGNATPIRSGPVPGTFTGNFTVDVNGTIYMRAHTQLAGGHNWSEEVMVQVNDSVPAGTQHDVSIATVGQGYAGNYDPASITIRVGDTVVWTNMDAAFSHTATSDAGTPAAFDTNSLSSGGVSNPILFTVPGTYAYHCGVHTQTMTCAITMARVIVEA